jgi:sugar phosphate isomerase/epimerase
MKLCAFADEASPNLTGQIAALRRNEIPYLEIRGVNGKNIKDVTSDEAKEIKKALDAEGISVWSMGSPIGKIALDGDFEGHLDDFKRILESADIFGATHVRMFSFFPVKGESPEKTQDQVLRHIEKMLSLTPSHIMLCHENEKDIFGENTENCLMLHQNFPRLRGVFDLANFVQCGVDTKDAWQRLKPYIEYLHIKDAISDGTVVPCGMGRGNLPLILSDYLQNGGEVMTLEPHLFDFTGLSALENGNVTSLGISPYKDNDEAFDAAADALKNILTEIRRSL